MKSKKLIATTGIAAFMLAVGLNAATIGTVVAEELENTTANIGQQKVYMKHHMLQNVECKVENTDNGIQITMTSTDADTVAKLQSSQHRKIAQKGEQKIAVTQTNLQNGVQITVTSEDPATVTKLQEGPKNGHEFLFGPGKNKMLRIKDDVKKSGNSIQ